MSYLERIVTLYLDYAELQAERKIPMSMEDWAKRLDGFLEFNGFHHTSVHFLHTAAGCGKQTHRESAQRHILQGLCEPLRSNHDRYCGSSWEHLLAKLHAETEFEKYRIIQDQLYESDFDRFLAME